MAGDGDVHPPSPYSDCSLWTSLFTIALSSDGVTWGPGGGGGGVGGGLRLSKKPSLTVRCRAQSCLDRDAGGVRVPGTQGAIWQVGSCE